MLNAVLTTFGSVFSVLGRYVAYNHSLGFFGDNLLDVLIDCRKVLKNLMDWSRDLVGEMHLYSS